MTHRADQIISAIVSAIDARMKPKGVHVFEHRRDSLDEDQDELPAYSVDFGEDNPADVDETGGYFDSLLTVPVTGVVALPIEEEAKAEALDLRRQAAIAICADRTLGLSFVINTMYGGADAPVVDASSGLYVVEYTSIWTVYYRMNISDPGD